MMIDVALCEIHVRAEFGKRALETFRGGNRAQRTDERVAQRLQRQLFARKNILKIKRFVRAFDNFRGAIVTPDPSHQLEIRLAGVFRNKNVAGAAKIARPLAQGAPRQQELVPKRCLSIHEHHVQPMLEMEILESVVEQQRVDLPFIDGEPATFHPVFVHEYDNIL